MTPTNSYATDGMILCAMNDPSGRRGIWVRFPNEPEVARTTVKPTVVEIFAGREGDDVQLRLALGDVVTHEELDKLARCLLVGAANCEDFVEDPETGGLYPPDRVPAEIREHAYVKGAADVLRDVLKLIDAGKSITDIRQIVDGSRKSMLNPLAGLFVIGGDSSE